MRIVFKDKAHRNLSTTTRCRPTHLGPVHLFAHITNVSWLLFDRVRVDRLHVHSQRFLLCEALATQVALPLLEALMLAHVRIEPRLLEELCRAQSTHDKWCGGGAFGVVFLRLAFVSLRPLWPVRLLYFSLPWCPSTLCVPFICFWVFFGKLFGSVRNRFLLFCLRCTFNLKLEIDN